MVELFLLLQSYASLNIDQELQPIIYFEIVPHAFGVKFKF